MSLLCSRVFCSATALAFLSLSSAAQTDLKSQNGQSSEVRPESMEVGVLALECANYAKYLGDEPRFEQLMITGRDKVVNFLNAFTEGEITEDEYREHVGLGISYKLRAPTADFAAGRVFEYYSGLVDHWVSHERNPDGSVDETRKREPWDRQVEEARRLYQKNKCFLIE